MAVQYVNKTKVCLYDFYKMLFTVTQSCHQNLNDQCEQPSPRIRLEVWQIKHDK